MRTSKLLHLNSLCLLITVCGLAFSLAPTPSHAQSMGPVIDVCSSGSVSYADETVCLYGNISTPGQATAQATASADLTECCYLSEIGVDLQLLDNGRVVSDTGEPGSTYESTSVVPNDADVYTATGWIDGCYGSSGSCYWEEHMASVSAQGGLAAVLYPAYKVASIIYDTPGNRGMSGFDTGTTDGSHTSVSSNFTQGASVTYTSGSSFLNLGGTLNVNFEQAVTTGHSSQVTDTFTSGTSVSNISAANPINHSQDMFLVWLNPAVSLTSSGQNSALFSTSTQTGSNGNPEPVDQVEVFTYEMQGSNGIPSFTPAQLEMQYDSATGYKDLPGMAAICANLNVSEYDNFQCTQGDQCGCKNTDFAGMLAQDPLVGYARTESPLDADTSGSGTCGQLPSPPSSAKCRYVPVPTSLGYQQTSTLQGPTCQTCNYPSNGGDFEDQHMTAQEYSETISQNVGYSWKLQFGIGSFASGSSWQWSNSESSGSINGHYNAMRYAIQTNTLNCNETVNVFYDTVYHTYVFQDASDNGLCQ